jgi:outer membrane protein assembly factor BamE
MPCAARVFPVIAALVLAGCARAPLPVPQVVKPYRIVIQQGNYVTREMVDQLKTGMTKEQVRFILGTPLLTDVFHADRWDYVFYRDAPGAKREQRSFSVVFEDGRLARVIGDILPGEPAQPAAKPAAKPEPAKPDPAKAEAKPAPRPETPAAAAQPAAGGNWSIASDAVPPAPQPDAGAKPEAGAADAGAGAKPAEPKPEAKPEEKRERGFFGRILERIGF